eukprot:6943811-Pyramimonas_sp.AAC.1
MATLVGYRGNIPLYGYVGWLQSWLANGPHVTTSRVSTHSARRRVWSYTCVVADVRSRRRA